MSFYVMNDTEYERLRAIGQEAYLYNYQIHQPEQYQASTDELESLIASNPAQPLSYVAVDPKNSDIENGLKCCSPSACSCSLYLSAPANVSETSTMLSMTGQSMKYFRNWASPKRLCEKQSKTNFVLLTWLHFSS